MSNKNAKMVLYILLVIMLVSAGLRFYSIHFGNPFRYHPDEVKLLSTAGRLLETRFVDPEAYFSYGIYPVFYTLLLAALIGVFIVFGLLTGRFSSFEDARLLYDQNPFPFLAVGRYFVALLGVFSVYIFYLLLKKLYNRTIAMLGALLLAVNFVHVRNSHFSTVDVPATFFTLLGLYFCALVMEKSRRRDYILAAVFIGLAFATKFSLFLLAVPFIYAHFAASVKNTMTGRLLDKKFWMGALAGILTFVIACPILVLDFQRTWGGIMRTKKFESVGKIGSGGGFLSYWTGQQAEGFGVFYPNSIPHTFGVLLTLFAAAGIIYLLYRHRKSDLLLLVFLVPSYLMFESMAYRAMRHILPLIPFILAAAAILLFDVCMVLKSNKIKYVFAVAAGLLIVIIPAVKISGYLYHLGRPDPRTQALKWCMENIPAPASIAVESFPPYLPGYQGNYTSGEKQFEIYEMKLMQRDERRSQTLVKMISDNRINYYIMDGFTRHVFDWRQTRRRYPEIVKDRKKFFRWLDMHGRIIAEFIPEHEKILPAVRIYRIQL